MAVPEAHDEVVRLPLPLLPVLLVAAAGRVAAVAALPL